MIKIWDFVRIIEVFLATDPAGYPGSERSVTPAQPAAIVWVHPFTPGARPGNERQRGFVQ